MTPSQQFIATATWPEPMRQVLDAEVKQLAPYTNRAGYDADDLLVAGAIACTQTLASFDPSFGVRFDVYFRRVVLRRKFISLGRRNWLGSNLERQLDRTDYRSSTTTQTQLEVRDVIAHMHADDPDGHRKREAFALYHLEGYKLRELAERFGVKLGLVQRWVKQGEAAFAQLWNPGEA